MSKTANRRVTRRTPMASRAKTEEDGRCVPREDARARARREGGKGARQELDAADLGSAVANPPPRRSCTGRRGLRRLDRRPPACDGAGTGKGPHLSRTGGRARARLPHGGAAAKARERQRESKVAATPPHKGERGGGGALALTGTRTACRRAHARAPTDGASAADRQGRRRRAREGAESGRGERAWRPKRRAAHHRARRHRCAATGLPPPRLTWRVPPTRRPTGNSHTAGYKKNPHSGQNRARGGSSNEVHCAEHDNPGRITGISSLTCLSDSSEICSVGIDHRRRTKKRDYRRKSSPPFSMLHISSISGLPVRRLLRRRHVGHPIPWPLGQGALKV